MSKNNGLILRGDVWYMRFSLKGNHVYESTGTTVKREAEMILAKRKSEMIEDVVLHKKRPINLYEAFDQYVGTRTTEASKKNADACIRVFKAGLRDCPIKKLQKSEVDAVIQAQYEKGHTPGTIQMRINYWNAFANWCAKQKYMIFGKVDGIKNVKGKIRWLTLEEQTKLLEVVHPSYPYKSKNDLKDSLKQDNWDLLVFLLDTGVRYSECSDMQWHQVDLEKRHIYVNREKGGKDTALTITNRLHAVLTRRKPNHDTLVFPAKYGKNNNSVWMRDAVKRAGLSTVNGSVTLHTCRHTFAATMLQNGVSLNAVSHLLGHSSVMITTNYAHFIKQDESNKAADILNRLNA